jgi:hypothetical protein
MKEEFRPQPENPKQNAPEAGAGPIGLPPPDLEQTNLLQGKAEGNPPVEDPSLTKRRGAVFECAIPRVIPSPYDLRRMLREGSITEEQAQEAEQEWRENLKTWDRQRLEKAISSLEESRDRSARLNRQEAVRDIEYELKTLRAELR